MARRRTTRSRRGTRSSSALSPRTKKAISKLSPHQRHIYRRAHAKALRQYKSPAKRRGGRSQSREQVAHKVAWAAVRRGRGGGGLRRR